jgi:CRISPR-associated endonuclease/helicase Cas3
MTAYFELADRPALALWGKARAKDGAASPAHPLAFHMFDVAAVTELLLDEVLPRGTSTRLLTSLEADRAASRAWLVLLAALHDLGKATPAFQVKWPPAIEALRARGFDLSPPAHANDHGTMGVGLVRESLTRMGLERMDAHRLARAVAAHHGSFPTDAASDVRKLSRAERGAASAWDEARAELVAMLASVVGVSGHPRPRVARPDDWGFFSALAGVISVADWVGSMDEVFAYTAPSMTLEAYAPIARARARRALEQVGFRVAGTPIAGSFEALFGFPPRPLQTAMGALVDATSGPFCAVVEAPMGEGKTEAALYVAHALAARGQHDGTYLGLPTQATANQMFARLSDFLEHTRPDQRVNLQLVHGEAVLAPQVRALIRAVYADGDGLVCEPWFLGKKRALLAPFSAGTIDQALLGVLRTRHAFVRQLGLAAKTVVFDEVHAYDTYTSTLLDRLVAWLGALGATVVILSATLPSARRRALLAAYAGRRGEALQAADAPYPRVSWSTAASAGAEPLTTDRRGTEIRLAWIDDDEAALTTKLLALAEAGGCIGVLRNTVARAQSLFRALLASRDEGALPPDTELLLLHARFPGDERRAREERLVSRLGRRGDRPARMIVVGTQVLEQSLDVDFDAMVTDLAPADLVLQRAGRLHRHARPARPASAMPPTLTIVAPTGEAESCDLRPVGAVYEPYVLRRSLLLLRERPCVRLPDDIEPMVEHVYTDAPRDLPSKLAREWETFTAERQRDEALARDRVWPLPTGKTDPFAAMHAWFEEDDPDVARALRAETRLGDDSIEVVCLFGDEQAAFLDPAHMREVNISGEPTIEDVRALASRTVRISTRGLVQTLRAQAAPAAWAAVPTLARRRLLLFNGAPVRLLSFCLELHVDLGLVIDREGG